MKAITFALFRSTLTVNEQVPSKELGCYVMDGVMYTSHADGNETSRKATDEELLLADALLRATDELREAEADTRAANVRTDQMTAEWGKLKAQVNKLTVEHAWALGQARAAHEPPDEPFAYNLRRKSDGLDFGLFFAAEAADESRDEYEFIPLYRHAQPPPVTPTHIEAALMALAWVEQFISDGNSMLARQNLNIAKSNLQGALCRPRDTSTKESGL